MQEALPELSELEKDRLRARKSETKHFLMEHKKHMERNLSKWWPISEANTEYGKVPSKISADLGMDTKEKRQRAQAVALMPRLHSTYKVSVNVHPNYMTS